MDIVSNDRVVIEIDSVQPLETDWFFKRM